VVLVLPVTSFFAFKLVVEPIIKKGKRKGREREGKERGKEGERN
jgi:hypothetical protein